MPFTLQNMAFQHAKGHVLISHLMPSAKAILFQDIICLHCNILQKNHICMLKHKIMYWPKAKIDAISKKEHYNFCILCLKSSISFFIVSFLYETSS